MILGTHACVRFESVATLTTQAATVYDAITGETDALAAD